MSCALTWGRCPLHYGNARAQTSRSSPRAPALRRTFASLCSFAGRDLRWVMGQLGHDDPRMTLAIYVQCMKRNRIDEGLVWTLMRFPDEPERPTAARRW
jgi:integrase